MINVNKTETRNPVSFGAGLTKNTISKLSNLSADTIADEFRKVYKTDVNFRQNPVIAACNALCADIFEYLSQKFRLPFSAVPKRLLVYDKFDLVKTTDAGAFCIPDTRKVLNSELPFELRSIFFEQNKLSLKDVDDLAGQKFNQNFTSSNHFLAGTVHEWVHNVHLDLLYKKYGYEGLCPYGRKLYGKDSHNTGVETILRMQNQGYTPEQKALIAQTIGEYTANPLEVVAETYTKLICDSLDKNTLLPKRNPFETLKNYPKEFREILTKAENY